MQIIEITNQNTWQEFFDENGSHLTFLESAEWSDFLAKTGHQAVKLGIYERDRLQAIALVEKLRSKRGNFLFVPHGPIISKKLERRSLKRVLADLQNYLIKIAQKENFDFIRIAPSIENTDANLKIFRDLGFRTAPIYLHSENFWITPLEKSEDEILAQMRKTTRYLIRKAQKENVVIEKSTDSKTLSEFFKVYKETIKREKFAGYTEDYIRKEFNAFNETKNADIFVGKHDGTVLASALVLFTKDSAFYHQGASIHSKTPVPYLLQWEAVKEAKKRGCKFYNFWGTLIPHRTPKSWSGLTTFKTGFGGFERAFVPTQDYIISRKYYLTNIYERLLSWKRGV